MLQIPNDILENDVHFPSFFSFCPPELEARAARGGGRALSGTIAGKHPLPENVYDVYMKSWGDVDLAM
ncbi:MAG: hypothetical protein ACXVIB_06160 [Halobacteriota archaeon]